MPAMDFKFAVSTLALVWLCIAAGFAQSRELRGFRAAKGS